MASEAHVDRPSPPLPSPDWALFLDVDGTLLDFASTPSGVDVPPSLPALLERIRRRLGGALAVVSGRPLRDIDAFFAPFVFAAAGLHGLQRRRDDGRLEDEPALPAELTDLATRAGAIAARHPGAVVEEKGPCLALHWRGAPDAATELSAFADEALTLLRGYRLQRGKCVVELRPEGGDKGDAIAAFLEEAPFRGRLPVFVGDDRTDEHGFEVVRARGGVAVLVGTREPSAATHALPDPSGVRRWLRSFSAEGDPRRLRPAGRLREQTT